jgi:hypothetical protein
VATQGFRSQWIGVAGVALAAALLASPRIAAGTGADVASDVPVKAVFLYNFVKFATWPALLPGAPIIACVVGDERIADALVETVRGQTISGHTFAVRRSRDSATWSTCHLLFIADAETQRSAAGLDEIKRLAVLTVSDRQGFAQAGGIIEFYVEGARMHFAINVDAAERSGVHLSSRLLGLAKVVRDGLVQ